MNSDPGPIRDLEGAGLGICMIGAGSGG